MKDKIIGFLKENKECSAYSVMFNKVSSKELFFVKDKLDMNRGKDVFRINITVYKDFEADGKKYRGSATCKVSVQDSDETIKAKIADSVFAAGFVKNEWYPLPKPSSKSEAEQSCCADSLMESILKMKRAVYTKQSGQADINSAEFFANHSEITLVNSEGLDVSFSVNSNIVEVITDCTGDEEVEIYGYEEQGEICEASLKEIVKEQLQNTSERAIAKKASPISSINVILRDDSIPEFFDFYKNQASSYAVYTGQSLAKVGENFQGNVKGDGVSITLDPTMKGSPHSAPYDVSGIALKKNVIFDKGVVKTYHGSLRFAHYLGIEPTGNIENMEVALGSMSYEKDMKASPYVEILMFSDFFMDNTTGNFGGEFRLARYFDGHETHIITGGSISGNMFKSQEEMYFAKEMMQRGGYKGPKAVLLPNMEIVG